jgi:hypothetical protein
MSFVWQIARRLESIKTRNIGSRATACWELGNNCQRDPVQTRPPQREKESLPKHALTFPEDEPKKKTRKKKKEEMDLLCKADTKDKHKNEECTINFAAVTLNTMTALPPLMRWELSTRPNIGRVTMLQQLQADVCVAPPLAFREY